MKYLLLGITSKNLEGSTMSWGEMLTYLGLWILMSAVTNGGNNHIYWDHSYPSNFKGDPFIIHSFMSFARFDAITKALYFTDSAPPLYRDNFWEV